MTSQKSTTQASAPEKGNLFQVLKAADTAARWHAHQRRKGSAQEPYINHLLEVAMLVADATGGTDTNLVIAALLHDAIEDCKVPKELIAETFGEDVASIVEEVTDDKNLAKEVRKAKQVETASTKSPRAKLLKLADKTCPPRQITGTDKYHCRRCVQVLAQIRLLALRCVARKCAAVKLTP